MMRFADPIYFSLFVLILPMIYFASFAGGRIRFSDISILKKVKGHRPTFHPRMILLLLRVLALIFFILAIARPQSGKTFTETSSEGVDIVLAVDTSGSMKALDFELEGKRVDRLTVVKKVVSDFIDKRPADRIGLIVFGSEAFTQCPLTLDHGILLDFMKKVEIGMAGEATAIGSAIGTSVNRMKDLKAKSKILILLTDGRNTAGRISPLKAAEMAKLFNIKVYTIGAGTKGKAPFLVDSFFGERFVYQDVDIDDTTLREISKITDGQYYRATDTSELAKIYDEIDKLEKTKVEVKQYTEYNELFHWFLIIALCFLFAEILLGHTKLRKIP